MDQDSYSLLEKESGEINWFELQPHFARGVVVLVGKEHDIIKVAMDFVSDNTNTIEEMLDDGDLIRVTDEQARSWVETNPLMKSIVIAPWVLVQEISIT